MTEKPIDLDQHRGLSAQRATESRRLLSEVEAHEAKLHRLRVEAEEQFLALPAATWEEAAVKAKYLLRLHAETLAGGDARTRRLIAAVLEDFERLSVSSAEDP
ncbi:hypothetical protein [Enhydrobacter sp.]|uniref:hypothetical protein n=1 Tax=Enhydrobacter sp. TaxID=1894999 RepID=UPI00261747BA|nr:hypothetical protein [Enhydrobacter sp.]WIM10182.1 MAG: hypothetical protein OJF58_001137 [Enhydrobacter sp.]